MAASGWGHHNDGEVAVRQLCLTDSCILGLGLVLAVGGTSAVEASDFTLGLKAWNASLSAGGLDGGDDLFPGVYFSRGVTERLWISAGYVEGEVDFTAPGLNPTLSRSIEEVDSDFIVGWSFAKLDVGVGYRFAEFKVSFGPTATLTSSNGPVVYLGGGDLFGQSHWGYYWGVAYMFEDLDDDDGAQEHFNGEGGFRWTSQSNISILFGYRHKEYFGDGGNFTFAGPAVNLAYTWR